jgi:hypothetical protein
MACTTADCVHFLPVQTMFTSNNSNVYFEPSIANINAFNPDYINRGGGIVQSSVQQEQHVRDDRPRLYHGTNDTTTINRHSQKGGNSDRDRSPIRYLFSVLPSIF